MKLSAIQENFLGELSTKLNGEEIEKLKDVITTLLLEEWDTKEKYSDFLERYEKERINVDKMFIRYFSVTEKDKKFLKRVCAPTLHAWIIRNILEEED